MEGHLSLIGSVLALQALFQRRLKKPTCSLDEELAAVIKTLRHFALTGKAGPSKPVDPGAVLDMLIAAGVPWEELRKAFNARALDHTTLTNSQETLS